MSDFRSKNVGRRIDYQCDDCGGKALSQPMPPPPALGIYGLPDGWALGLDDSIGDSPVYCAECAPRHHLAEGEAT